VAAVVGTAMLSPDSPSSETASGFPLAQQNFSSEMEAFQVQVNQ
jgi:hypothetical protein